MKVYISKEAGEAAEDANLREEEEADDDAQNFESVPLEVADIKQAQHKLFNLPDDDCRGLVANTFLHFGFGYLETWRHPKMPNTQPTARIIAPLGDKDTPAYNAILTNSERQRVKPLRDNTDKPPRWTEKSLTVGNKFVFNPRDLEKSIVAVLEGEIDTASIWQSILRGRELDAGNDAINVGIVALGGTGGASKDLLSRLKAAQQKPKVIVLFDPDQRKKQPGQKESTVEKTLRELADIGVVAVAEFFDDFMSDEDKQRCGGKIDANAILQTHGNDKLFRVFAKLVAKAKEDFKQAQAGLQALQSAREAAKNQHDDRPRDSSPEIDALITKIKDDVPISRLVEKGYLQHSERGAAHPDGYCCPWCNSGNGTHKTGTLKIFDDRRVGCAKCNEGGDVFSVYAHVKNMSTRGKEFFVLLRAIADEFNVSYDPKIFEPPENKSSAQIATLKIKLNEIDKEIDAFDEEKIAALEKLRDVEKFDSKTVFADEVITAAAFARLTDQQAFSDFRREVKIYGDKHKDEKANVNSWVSAVKDRATEIINRQKSLVTKRNKVQARINSLSFVGKNNFLDGVTFPAEYSVTAERGIEKVTGDNVVTVCRRPIAVVEKIYSVDEKISKLVLAFMTTTGTWKKIPPAEKAIVFNRNRIIDLANSDLPVTSSNAALVVDYLDAFNTLNEDKLPLTHFVNRGGWLSVNGKEFFIDPRRDTIIDDNGKKISVKVDTSRSEFAQHLKAVGRLDEWKKAYLLAKKAPVARLMVAAAVAPPLLKILGERNFLLYVYAPTRAGKTTALYLGTSAVGGKKINRSFDATKNGLAGAAADVNDYCFPVDEKQVADNRISEQLTALVYALGNGVGRTKLNRDSTLKEAKDWRTIAIATGETLLLPDNVTGGANTRLLTVKAPKEILSAADCKVISETIRENYGLAFPLVVEKILQTDRQKLRGMFDQMSAAFEAKYPEILSDHRRYMALLTLADAILNAALFGNKVTTPDGESILTSDDAIINAAKIFLLIPTITEVSDTPREKDFVRSFIGHNQTRFVGGLVDMDRMQAIYGKLKDEDGFTYVSAKALKDACKTEGFDYRKLVADLVADGFFKPADKVEKGLKTARPTIMKDIGKTKMRCHRIPNKIFYECE